MLSIMFSDIKVLKRAYFTYGRYVICFISLIGMLAVGRYPYRIKSVYSIALFILAVLNVVTSLWSWTKKPLVETKGLKRD